MREPLMSTREVCAYLAVLLLSILSIWITLRICPSDSMIMRIVSLIPAGIVTAIWIAMTIGILSALRYRSPTDE